MESLRLVRAEKPQAPLAQAMQQEAFAQLLEKYQDHDTNPANESLERITWKIKYPDSYYYFIWLGDTIIGAIRVHHAKDGSRKKISPLYILPAYRGKGYAQWAIREAERIHGSTHWELFTILQEPRNCYLYEKMGYRRTGFQKEINGKMTIVGYEKDE